MFSSSVQAKSQQYELAWIYLTSIENVLEHYKRIERMPPLCQNGVMIGIISR